MHMYIHQKVDSRISTVGFPGGTMVKNLPANAGHTGLEPWSRKIPYAAEQLSSRTTTTEPVLYSP